MPRPDPAAFDFLQTRRSRPASTLAEPVPDRTTLETLLSAAARTPDHGKLEPWRFIVLGKGAMSRLAEIAQERGQAIDLEAEKITKGRCTSITATARLP